MPNAMSYTIQVAEEGNDGKAIAEGDQGRMGRPAGCNGTRRRYFVFYVHEKLSPGDVRWYRVIPQDSDRNSNELDFEYCRGPRWLQRQIRNSQCSDGVGG